MVGRLHIALFCVLGVLVSPASGQTTWYVDDDAISDPGPGDPSVSDPVEDGSAQHPYDAIQEAIDVAADGDEVVVLAGTYRGAGNREMDYGGRLITVRSEDPNASSVVAATIIDCQSAGRAFTFHSDETPDAVLAGVTVTRGNAPREQYVFPHGQTEQWAVGGAVRCDRANPSIINCVFQANYAGNLGGAVQCLDCEDGLVVRGCLFVGNISSDDSGALGMDFCSATVRACTFTRNYAGYGGGASTMSAGTSEIVNCLFQGNSAGRHGGAIRVHGSSDVFQGCTFLGNWCHDEGGAVHVISSGASAFRNCTFAHNTADYGGGLICKAASTIDLMNCILWANAAPHGPQLALIQQGTKGSGVATLSYCCIQGGADGAYVDPTSSLTMDSNLNYDSDPLLTPDGHLRIGSPCLNAGDPTSGYGGQVDRDEEPRVLQGRVDLGADEFSDTDADGLPDWWEESYFGASEAADPSHDEDGDGGNNLHEYEHQSSHPNTPPYFVSVIGGNDTYDGLAATWNGTHGPKRTIQAALDIAGDGDTVIVLPGTYAGTGNKNLAFSADGIVLRSMGGSASTVFDCEGSGRPFNYPSLLRRFTVIEGFHVINGGESSGTSLYLLRGRMRNVDCMFSDGEVSGNGVELVSLLSSQTVAGVCVSGHTSAGGATQPGLVSRTCVTLEDDLTVQGGALTLESAWFEGEGTLRLDPNSVLRVSGATDWGPTVLRADVSGPGDIVIDAGQRLVVGGSAVLDLDRQPGDEPNNAMGGEIVINGSLLAKRGASIRNATISVKEAEFEGENAVHNNNVTLLETSAGFGGQFFVEGDTTVSGNAIFSEGDRYLDLDPDPNNPNPHITQNDISVVIKQVASTEEGTLLELRAMDYDAGGPNNPAGLSGAFQVPETSAGFTADPSANWVLEELALESGAKLNLTNRQGFVFQDDLTHPETVYVKRLMLGSNAVLNTGLQTLYYQELLDGNGQPMQRDPNALDAPLANGSRIIDVPLLGFSLAIITMEDDTEFDLRIRKRVTDPEDFDPNNPEAPLPRGSIVREEGVLTGEPENGGMVMCTRADGEPQSSSSVASKGAFARAGDEMVTVVFEYLFQQGPDAELIVSLSDRCEVGKGNVELATIRQPASGRAGSIGSDRAAVFYGRFPRGVLNFTRGTYVELELRGHDAKCWVDNWDPQIQCTDYCSDADGNHDFTEADYLYVLAEYGNELEALNPTNWCIDFNGDAYIDLNDLWGYEAFLEGATQCPLQPEAERAAPCDETSSEVRLDTSGTTSLVIAGKPNGAGEQGNVLYALNLADGTCQRTPENCAEDRGLGHGRLIRDGSDGLYELHSINGLMRLSDGATLVSPSETEFEGETITVGFVSTSEHSEDSRPLLDVAFHPTDANTVYVVPVVVHTCAGTHYRAAAKLHLLGNGNYDVLTTYGMDPFDDPTVTVHGSGGDVFFEPDVQHLREIEVDADGNLFVLSAQGLSAQDDWILIYDEAAGTPSERRINLNTRWPNRGGPTGLLISAYDPNDAFLTCSATTESELTTYVARLAIQRNATTAEDVSLAEEIAINNPEPNESYGLGFVSTVTAIAEDPSSGCLFVVGFTAPRYPDDYDGFADNDPLFTLPTMAEIFPGVSGPIASAAMTASDLGLPLSATVVGSGTCYSLSVAVQNSGMGSVTVDPNLPCYAPNSIVTLRAWPEEGRELKHWVLYDPNFPEDSNHAVKDSNLILLLTMNADHQVVAWFTCGSQLQGLLPLAAVVMLGLAVASLRRR